MKKIMYEQIHDDIIKDIQNGVYLEKDILPSEKELAAKYNVSRITTGKAMSLLVEEGIVERVRGKGTFVCDDVKRVLNGDEKNKHHDGNHNTEFNMIGVIVDAFDLEFGTHLLKGIERECYKNNMGMFLRCTYGSVEAENEAIQTALTCGCKGLILVTVQGETYSEMLLKLALDHVPIVLADRELKGLGIPCIKTDNYKATWELLDALVKQGHKKICLVNHAYEATSTVMERSNAFRDFMMQNSDCRGTVRVLQGYNDDLEKQMESYSSCDLTELEEIVAAEECTAFVAVEYKLGMMLQEVCDRLDMERKICVFDDLYEIFNKGKYFMHVKQNEYQMGVEAVRMIMRIINGESTENSVLVPYKIVEC